MNRSRRNEPSASSNWFGILPSRWGVKRVKHLLTVVNGGTPSADQRNWNGEHAWITPDDLSPGAVRMLEATRRTLSEQGILDCAAQLSPAGSLVVSCRAPVGYVGLAAVQSCTNQGCKTLVPDEDAAPDYYFYVLIAARDALTARSNGTTFLEISTQGLKSLPIPWPPLREQWAIAAFLDRETARIDALVAAKRRLIALL
jgi:type I restriction enzyme, S subunit